LKAKQDIIVFCRSGNRSSQAKSILESKGISNIIDGGPWENVAQYSG
jgi:phage shock protein E